MQVRFLSIQFLTEGHPIVHWPAKSPVVSITAQPPPFSCKLITGVQVSDTCVSSFLFMKIHASLIAFAVASIAHAQTWTPPPASLIDGVVVKPAGQNAGAGYWGGVSSLGAYAVASDANTGRILPETPDSNLGLTWSHTAPASLQGALAGVNQYGGTVRAIFVGETAQWRNNFGYSRSGDPSGAGSYTAFGDVQAAGGSPNMSFGDHVDIALTRGGASTFDLWFNAVDESRGGVYSVFNTLGEASGAGAQQFVWAVSALSVNTWVPSLGAYANIDTYLISAEDQRFNADTDGDYSDFRFALQFLTVTGESMAPIPEPAHFAAALGLAAVVGAAVLRRRRVTTA